MTGLSSRLLIIVIVALLPSLAFQGYAEIQARQVRQQIMEDHALRLVRLVRSEEHRIVEGAVEALRVIASSPSVRIPRPGPCRELFRTLVKESPRYISAGAEGLDGIPFCQSIESPAALNTTDRLWFRRALESGGTAIGEYDRGDASDLATIHLSRPFRDTDGQVAGVVEVALSLQWMNEQLAKLGLPSDSTVTVTDHKGIVLAQYPRGMETVGQPLPPERQSFLEGGDIRLFHSLTNAPGGRPGLVTVSPPGADPWGLTVIVCLDEANTFAALTRADHLGLTLIAGGALLAIVLTIAIGHRLIRRPVEKLLGAAGLWRNGDFAARTGLLADRSEFGRIAMAFDAMATTLQTREAALRDSEATLRLAMTAARLGVCEINLITREGTWSVELAEIVGCAKDDYRTMDAWIADIHPDDLEAVTSAWQRALSGAQHYYASEYRLCRPDGGWRWIAAYGQPIFDAGRPIRAVVVIQDISARKHVEEALRDSEHQLRVTQEAARIGSFDRDLVTGAVQLSDLQSRRFGIDPAGPEKFTEETWRRCVYPADLARTEQSLSAAIGNRSSFAVEYRIMTPDGLRWMDARGNVIYAPDGTPLRMTGIDIDITERRALEDELRSLTANLEARVRTEVAAREAAQARATQAERLQALGQLAGGIAHDINNVLQAVAGALALIAGRSGDEAAVQRFARLGSEAIERGASVTGRLLAFGRRGDLRAEPIEVPGLLNGLHEILSHTLGAEIDVRVSLPDGLPTVVADKGQLETVLINLATNARDAMPNGGRLVLASEQEQVAAGDPPHPADLQPGEYVRFAVADTGTGMDLATLARAREPFFTTKASGAGTGLGLAMAQGFAEQSGGGLSIESESGKGTTVTLWLPAAAMAPAPARRKPAQRTTASPAVSVRILLVDDEPMIREVLATCLRDAGWTVLAAASGAAALDLLAAVQSVDILLTDLSMPGMDGLALIKAVQTLSPGLPAILLTGYAADITALGLSGNVSLLRKPVSAVQLLDRLDTMLAGRWAETGERSQAVALADG